MNGYFREGPIIPVTQTLSGKVPVRTSPHFVSEKPIYCWSPLAAWKRPLLAHCMTG